MIFDTKIAGIPCQCQVTSYTRPSREYIHSASLEPPEYGDFTYRILDRKGYPAPWLEAKLGFGDEARLVEEFQLQALGERYGYL